METTLYENKLIELFEQKSPCLKRNFSTAGATSASYKVVKPERFIS